MSKGRLEAFSDGVIAVIITILVLEMKVPHGTEASALAFVSWWIAGGLYVLVAAIWLCPDPRIEKLLPDGKA